MYNSNRMCDSNIEKNLARSNNKKPIKGFFVIFQAKSLRYSASHIFLEFSLNFLNPNISKKYSEGEALKNYEDAFYIYCI